MTSGQLDWPVEQRILSFLPFGGVVKRAYRPKPHLKRVFERPHSYCNSRVGVFRVEPAVRPASKRRTRRQSAALPLLARYSNLRIALAAKKRQGQDDAPLRIIHPTDGPLRRLSASHKREAIVLPSQISPDRTIANAWDKGVRWHSIASSSSGCASPGFSPRAR